MSIQSSDVSDFESSNHSDSEAKLGSSDLQENRKIKSLNLEKGSEPLTAASEPSVDKIQNGTLSLSPNNEAVTDVVDDEANGACTPSSLMSDIDSANEDMMQNNSSGDAKLLPKEISSASFSDSEISDVVADENTKCLSTNGTSYHDMQSSNENLANTSVASQDSQSHDTETCSEEEFESDGVLEENASKKNASVIREIRNVIQNQVNNKTVVTGFTLHDGSHISIDEKYLHQPIVVELGNILDAFLNKVKLKPELSNMVRKSQVKANAFAAKEEQIHTLTKNCKQLEKSNAQLRMQLKQVEEKLESHDQGAKRTISRLHKDYETKLGEMSKKCSVAENEKQSSVMNFARREKEVLDLRKQKETADQFAKTASKEKDKALGQLKQLKAEMSKLKSAHERKESANTSQGKEMEKMKEEINSQAIKVRWAQNKLKSEIESHKETKEKCEKMVSEIQQAKEETEQIRKNCQEMIKTYQESEEIKSNALDIEVKEKNQIIVNQKEELEKCKNSLRQKTEEMNRTQTKLTNAEEENQNLQSQLSALTQEQVKNEGVMRSYQETLNKQKATAAEMNEKMRNIEYLQTKIDNLNITVGNLNDELYEAVMRRDAALNDVATKQNKEQELLEFTEKVSSKNTQLTVELEELNTKVATQDAIIDTQSKKIASLESNLSEVSKAKEESDQAKMKYQTAMNSRLEEKERTICQLLLQFEELKDDMRTVKRKNAASIKDLTRQLNQVKRKSENTDALSSSSIPNSGGHSGDGGSLGSRTSSTTSLDKISYPSESHTGSQYEHISVPETTVTGPSSLDRQMLIERIVRLQQIHAKKNEKIDFLSEHVHQLVAELQKKQRLIQHYIMREESGALAPPRERHDPKRHGLTLELSVEMNQKMQSVLEDTLLKNITLKESLETLGQEVQRLSSTTKQN